MDWIKLLLFDTESIAHLLLLYSFVIAVGVLLGKLKFRGVSFGVAFILFTGIVVGHLGFTGNLKTIGFIQDFGLILFVYSLGLQVGPSFFTSFRNGAAQHTDQHGETVRISTVKHQIIDTYSNHQIEQDHIDSQAVHAHSALTE